MYVPDHARDSVTVAGHTLEPEQEFTFHERLRGLKYASGGEEAAITLIQEGEHVLGGSAEYYIYRRSRPSASGLDPEGEGRKPR